MPKMSRAERKRLGVQRPNAVAAEASTPQASHEIIDTVVASATATAANATASTPSRLVRSTRRVVARDAAASLDYATEATLIASDLRRIALWGSVFVIAMLVIKFAGLL